MAKIGFKQFFVIIIVVLWATTSWATPCLNDGTCGDIQYLEDNTTPYGYYKNSGTLVGTVQEGNNLGSPSTLEYVESLIEDALGYGSEFELEITANVTATFVNTDGSAATGASNTGLWSVVPPVTGIDFYGVKAGNFYAIYNQVPTSAHGSWSTYDIWKYASDNNLTGAGGNGGLAISHFTGYNPSAVPEPSTASWFIVLGTLGVIGILRCRQKSKVSV
jgi:hypothetical protein